MINHSFRKNCKFMKLQHSLSNTNKKYRFGFFLTLLMLFGSSMFLFVASMSFESRKIQMDYEDLQAKIPYIGEKLKKATSVDKEPLGEVYQSLNELVSHIDELAPMSIDEVKLEGLYERFSEFNDRVNAMQDHWADYMDHSNLVELDGIRREMSGILDDIASLRSVEVFQNGLMLLSSLSVEVEEMIRQINYGMNEYYLVSNSDVISALDELEVISNELSQRSSDLISRLLLGVTAILIFFAVIALVLAKRVHEEQELRAQSKRGEKDTDGGLGLNKMAGPQGTPMLRSVGNSSGKDNDSDHVDLNKLIMSIKKKKQGELEAIKSVLDLDLAKSLTPLSGYGDEEHFEGIVLALLELSDQCDRLDERKTNMLGSKIVISSYETFDSIHLVYEDESMDLNQSDNLFKKFSVIEALVEASNAGFEIEKINAEQIRIVFSFPKIKHAVA